MREQYQKALEQEKIQEREELEKHIKEEQRLRENLIKFYDNTWQSKYPGYSKWFTTYIRAKEQEHDMVDIWSIDYDQFAGNQQQEIYQLSGLHKYFEKQT